MIAIVDSGYGNLRSVEKALARVGGAPHVLSDPDKIRRADRVVVPGQGAFADCVAAFRERGLGQALREVIDAGRPYLGICLGLQVLFEDSEEQGPVAGLGLLAGRVVRLRPKRADEKVPHMGWNQVRVRGQSRDPLLAGVPDRAYFYFVHSYVVVPANADIVALTCDYGGEFPAAIRKDNLFACQFHPEKSQAVGLKVLDNFVRSA
jgi:imidazole glycerol-phosphate synthase subunit HisH